MQQLTFGRLEDSRGRATMPGLPYHLGSDVNGPHRVVHAVTVRPAPSRRSACVVENQVLLTRRTRADMVDPDAARILKL